MDKKTNIELTTVVDNLIRLTEADEITWGLCSAPNGTIKGRYYASIKGLIFIVDQSGWLATRRPSLDVGAVCLCDAGNKQALKLYGVILGTVEKKRSETKEAADILRRQERESALSEAAELWEE